MSDETIELMFKEEIEEPMRRFRIVKLEDIVWAIVDLRLVEWKKEYLAMPPDERSSYSCSESCVSRYFDHEDLAKAWLDGYRQSRLDALTDEEARSQAPMKWLSHDDADDDLFPI
jgi:hypothetical protein